VEGVERVQVGVSGVGGCCVAISGCRLASNMQIFEMCIIKNLLAVKS